MHEKVAAALDGNVGEAGVGIELERLAQRGRGFVAIEFAQGLAVGGHVGADVDQPGEAIGHELGRLGDGDAAERMADEPDIVARGADGGGDRLGIAGERHLGQGRRIVAQAGQVERVGGVAARGERGQQVAPAPPAMPCPVDENESRHQPPIPLERPSQ